MMIELTISWIDLTIGICLGAFLVGMGGAAYRELRTWWIVDRHRKPVEDDHIPSPPAGHPIRRAFADAMAHDIDEKIMKKYPEEW